MTEIPHGRLKSQLRIDEYRIRAVDAVALAETCGLPQLRARHEAAAAIWVKLADDEERRIAAALRPPSPSKPKAKSAAVSEEARAHIPSNDDQAA